MRAPSQLPLHPLAWLRLKLTSDETKEEQKKAGETSEPATLVIGELRFITLQGNNVLFFSYNESLLLMADIKDIVCEVQWMYNWRHFLLLCRGARRWADRGDCG